MLGHKQAKRGEERGEMKLIELIIRMILTSFTFNLLDRQLIMRGCTQSSGSTSLQEGTKLTLIECSHIILVAFYTYLPSRSVVLKMHCMLLVLCNNHITIFNSSYSSNISYFVYVYCKVLIQKS